MKKRVVMSLGILLAVLLIAAAVSAGQLSIGYENGATGEGKVVLIYFNTAGQALGAFSLDLAYDPQQVKIAGVTAGDNPYFNTVYAAIDNNSGILKVSGFQGSSMNEPVGNIVIARLQLQAEKAFAAPDLFKELKSEFLTPQGSAISAR